MKGNGFQTAADRDLTRKLGKSAVPWATPLIRVIGKFLHANFILRSPEAAGDLLLTILAFHWIFKCDATT